MVNLVVTVRKQILKYEPLEYEAALLVYKHMSKNVEHVFSQVGINENTWRTLFQVCRDSRALRNVVAPQYFDLLERILLEHLEFVLQIARAAEALLLDALVAAEVAAAQAADDSWGSIQRRHDASVPVRDLLLSAVSPEKTV